jgi:hypothetical protein
MRAVTVLGLLFLAAAASDLARQYPPASQPGLVSGTAASNAAGGGVPQPPGKELAHNGNQHLAHVYADLAR